MKISRKLSLAIQREKAKRTLKERAAKHPKPELVSDERPAEKGKDDNKG